MSKLVSFLSILAAWGLIAGCSEKAATPPVSPTASNDPTLPGANPLCDKLKANSFLMSSFKSFLDELCDRGRITSLRQSGTIYTGNGAATVTIVDRELTENRSEMQAYSSLMSPSNPRSYFNMLRLKIGRPDDFTSVFKNYNPDVTYKVLSGDPQSSVTYRYQYEHDVYVDYESTATFVTIEEGKTYAVTSQFIKKNETVIGVKGLIIVNAYEDGSNTFTEVFSMSDQLFENQGDHPKSISTANNRLQTEVNYDYKNSLEADRANSFFGN